MNRTDVRNGNFDSGFGTGIGRMYPGAGLPERVTAEYQAESCLAPPTEERLVLRLRRKADGALAVLKAAMERVGLL